MMEEFEKTEKLMENSYGETRLIEEEFGYSTKIHPFIGEISKESSFLSTGSNTSAETNDDPKNWKNHNLCGIFGLLLALVACLTGCYIMWATDLFTLFVHKNLIISNNSMRYESWKAPPVNALLRVYIFNYTNVDEYERDPRSKLKIQELGPYTYIEKWERVDVKFNENGTATYRDRRIYKFCPELSKGQEHDRIVVPNVPFLSTLSILSQLPFLFRLPLTSLIRVLGANPFIALNASDFLWGYKDRFSDLAQNILSLQYDLPFKKFGILSAKNGTQRDLVTIYTGEEDSSKTGIVASYDGKTALSYWNSAECNRIDGTDGTIYPPAMIHPNSTLYIYSKDLCRKIPLIYSDEYKDKHGIPVLRFQIPKSVFASGHVQKENLCFCNHEKTEVKCLPSGVFNVGPCAFKAPLVTSMPHFLHGDAILSKDVEGLKPVVDKHETYVEIDPSMGIPVGGKSRLQLNIMFSKNKTHKNDVVLPITWMDYGIDRLPDDVISMIKNLLIFIRVAQLSLSYGFIVCTAVFGYLLINGFRYNLRNLHVSGSRKKQRKETQSETPLFIIHEKKDWS